MPILIVSLVIGIIMVTAVILPLSSEYAEAKTFTNDGLWRMKEIAKDDVWTYDDSTHEWSYNSVSQGEYNIANNAILGEKWCSRSNGQLRGYDIGGNATTITASADETTISITGTGKQGSTSQDLPGYGIYSEGEYIMTKSDVPVYMNGDSKIFATGQTTIDSIRILIHIEASINDGVQIAAYDLYNSTSNPYPNTISDVVFTDAAINYESVNGYDDLYKVSSVTANISFTNTTTDEQTATKTGAITYNSYVVPYQVTADTDNPAAYKSLVMVIPLMAFVVLVVAAAAMIYYKKD